MPKHHNEDYKLSAAKYYLQIDNLLKNYEYFIDNASKTQKRIFLKICISKNKIFNKK
jgi:hypothetical protein